jgi:hypothetical protein
MNISKKKGRGGTRKTYVILLRWAIILLPITLLVIVLLSVALLSLARMGFLLDLLFYFVDDFVDERHLGSLI